MTESRLNDLALFAFHPTRLSELSTEKIIEMFVQANPRNMKLKRVGEYVDGVKYFLQISEEISFISEYMNF